MGKAARKSTGHDKYRREELAKIHIGKKDLNLSEDIYRDIIREAGGVESSADLDWRGRQAVLERFKELGWPSRPKADDPQSKKIRALWLELHAVGKVRDSSEKALASYVRRMTGVAALQWLNTRQASTVIEALKQWLER